MSCLTVAKYSNQWRRFSGANALATFKASFHVTVSGLEYLKNNGDCKSGIH